MAYKTFQEQLESHIQFLKGEGLQVENLDTGGRFVRCRALGEPEQGRGDYAYKSSTNPLSTGVGIVTWVRGIGGKESVHKTYGLSPGGNQSKQMLFPHGEPHKTTEAERVAKEKARLYFDVYSFESGESRYLEAKKVRAIGIRFHRSEKYGTAVVVPARNINGEIVTCQNINEDGSKRWLSGRQAIGAFHALSSLTNVPIIGICEGYGTSATCAEATEHLPIAIVCAFDAANLERVGRAIVSKHPKIKILFLADDDRHLVQADLKNKGLEAARSASNGLGAISTWVAPDFANLGPLKELSDWNDLARVRGIGEVRSQIANHIASLKLE